MRLGPLDLTWNLKNCVLKNCFSYWIWPLLGSVLNLKGVFYKVYSIISCATGLLKLSHCFNRISQQATKRDAPQWNLRPDEIARLELQPRMNMAMWAESAQLEIPERPRYGTLLLEDLHPAVVRWQAGVYRRFRTSSGVISRVWRCWYMQI